MLTASPHGDVQAQPLPPAPLIALCSQNPDANPRPTAQDLAGFWDLLQLSIEDISMKFDELYHLKANSWQLVETPEKRKVSMEQCGGEVQGQIPGRQ